VQIEMPVRSGMLDDKLLREVCRPKAGSEAAMAARRTADKVNEASGELRKANEALIQKDVKRALLANTGCRVRRGTCSEAGNRCPAEGSGQATRRRSQRPAEQAPAAQRQPGNDSAILAGSASGCSNGPTTGEGGPEHWGQLKPEYAGCATGKRQSPIDIRDGFRVDLEAIQFNYRPAPFRVIDNGHTIQVEVTGGGSISLLGKRYDLKHLHFHHPAEESVNGRSFAMVAHLVHAADDERIAVVAVLLETGSEQALIQTIWNNLPLERNQYVAPPDLHLDFTQLLPADQRYFTYMGSLSTPPCAEGVLWLVLKQPQQISPDQLAIFARLYPHNARPLQASFGRVIKESR
jgi:carbonic anhydrase